MPLIGFLWDYTPGPPFAAGTTFDGTLGAEMSSRPASAAAQFGYTAAPYLQAGDQQPMFGGDFYDRFHVSALAFDLGNLVGDQVRTVTVWNAYRRARMLDALIEVNADGITVSGQPAPPLQFAPQQERTYTLTVSVDGPPVIEATITFDFDEGQSLTVSLTGQRVTPWAWAPNWEPGMLERLEWRTDVLQSYRGEEQARSLRLSPRQIVEFSVLVDGKERRHMEAAVWNWGARVWAVPLWWDGLELAAPLASGATSIPLDASLRDFRAGTLALLLGATAREYEVVEIDEIGAGSIALVRPTARAWPTGSRLYPARTARLDGSATLGRFTGRASETRIRFEMVESAEWTAAHPAAAHRGYPVWEDRPNWTEDPEMVIERKLEVFDPQVGPIAVDDEAQMPLTAQRMQWLFDGRAEIDRFRKRMFALRGKQGRVWVPTWTEDFVPVGAIGAAALALDVEWCGYTLYQQGAVNRSDIRIELTTGEVFYRRITGSSEIDQETERLQLDSALGITVQPDDILLVSFLSLCRLESDAVELAWFTGEAVESATTLRSLRHDV